MFHTGLKKFEYANIDNFTTDIGMKIRKTLNKPWRTLLKAFTKRKIIIEQYPKLDKNKAYIFAANHSFDEDITSVLASIDRNAYLLHGTTHQMEHNPLFYAAYFNGMIYVNRLDNQSRKQAVSKMERVLRAQNSVLLFPEGGYNNTENQLIQPLFSSPWILSKNLEVEVVPIISFNDYGTETIYIRALQPMDLWQYEKQEALAFLRDAMATSVYEIMEEHTEMMKRSALGADPRKDYLEERKNIYAYQKWYEDVWEEELTYYPGHGVTTPKQAIEFVDRVHVDSRNAHIFANMLVRREEDRKYDLKRFMKDTFVLCKK